MLGQVHELIKNKEIEISSPNNKQKNNSNEGVFDKIDPKDYAEKNKQQIENKSESKYDQKTQKEGRGEAHKDIVKEEEKQQKLLEDVLEKSKKVLFHTKSVFPIDLFPDELTIDPTKVMIVHKEFFGSGDMDTVYIKDIAEVIVETGPYLATLNIVDVSYGASKHIIKKIKKDDALKGREIIEGLVTALKTGIDIMKLPADKILPSISELSGMQKIENP